VRSFFLTVEGTWFRSPNVQILTKEILMGRICPMSIRNCVMPRAHYDSLSISLPSGETGELAAKTALRSVIGGSDTSGTNRPCL
jgi:hypothetical protein